MERKWDQAIIRSLQNSSDTSHSNFSKHFTVQQLKFTRSQADPCLYARGSEQDRLWILVYVDDIAEFSINRGTIAKFELELYQQLVGGLLYIAICTRPDISDAIRNVATHTKEPTIKHFTATRTEQRHPSLHRLNLGRRQNNQEVNHWVHLH